MTRRWALLDRTTATRSDRRIVTRLMFIRVAVACTLWFGSGTPAGTDQARAAGDQSQGISVRVPGFDQAQTWFKRVRAHEIGQWDASAVAVAGLAPIDLQRILDDLRLIHLLLDNAAAKGTERNTPPARLAHELSPSTAIQRRIKPAPPIINQSPAASRLFIATKGG